MLRQSWMRIHFMVKNGKMKIILTYDQSQYGYACSSLLVTLLVVHIYSKSGKIGVTWTRHTFASSHWPQLVRKVLIQLNLMKIENLIQFAISSFIFSSSYTTLVHKIEKVFSLISLSLSFLSRLGFGDFVPAQGKKKKKKKLFIGYW